jgi:hypothetical protein
VVYDNHNRTDLVSKLRYFTTHPDEARAIAFNGFIHAMRFHGLTIRQRVCVTLRCGLRFHRAVGRIDYILRSSIDHARQERHLPPLHTTKHAAEHVRSLPQTHGILRGGRVYHQQRSSRSP